MLLVDPAVVPSIKLLDEMEYTAVAPDLGIIITFQDVKRPENHK